MKARITMAAIARRAGVHVTTVSMALRNHPDISAATKQKIKVLAAEMGYRPDPALGALMAYRRHAATRERTTPLAYITNWHTRWGWKQMVAHAGFFAGATERAKQLGYTLEHFWMGEPQLSQRRLNEILRARGIRGLIFASHKREVNAVLQFDWPEFAAVKIDYFPEQPDLHIVTNDQRAIMQLIMRRLRTLGFRRPGLVMAAWWDDYVDLAWSAGFMAEQQRFASEDQIPVLLFGEPTMPDHMTENDENFVVPRDRLQLWRKRHQPDVLVSHAPFLLPPLAAIGCAVPEDLPFVDMCLLETDGRNAGVRHNCGRVGELAVEIVAGQMQQNTFGVPQFSTTTLIEGTWFDGASLPSRVAPTTESARDPVATG